MPRLQQFISASQHPIRHLLRNFAAECGRHSFIGCLRGGLRTVSSCKRVPLCTWLAPCKLVAEQACEFQDLLTADSSHDLLALTFLVNFLIFSTRISRWQCEQVRDSFVTIAFASCHLVLCVRDSVPAKGEEKSATFDQASSCKLALQIGDMLGKLRMAFWRLKWYSLQLVDQR